ncbi:hypothetical protein [Streptomyces sp. NPDC056224]|uniref:hypothetical protein n=1 Tax=Streptomyces sp. NPDC056224 TaxID=3345750 RepID=UPI0035D87FB3
MKSIARVFAIAALVGAAALTTAGVANADGGSIDWPVPPTSTVVADTDRIDWP